MELNDEGDEGYSQSKDSGDELQHIQPRDGDMLININC